MSEKKDNLLVRIRSAAANALEEIEAGELELTRKEIASRAIIAYHKAWRARKKSQKTA